MTKEEKEIINGLLYRDNTITRQFFYVKCRPMFNGIIHDMFSDNADYDELVNELYYHLMKNDAKNLRSFVGNDKASLFAWMKQVARNLFLAVARGESTYKDSEGRIVKVERVVTTDEEGDVIEDDPVDEGNKDPQINIDANAFLSMVELERDRVVLKEFFLEGKSPEDIAKELGINTDNLYNIKARALKKLSKKARHATGFMSLCEILCEQHALAAFGAYKSIVALKDIASENRWLSPSGVAITDFGRLCSFFGLSIKAGLADLEQVSEAILAGHQVLVAVDGGELTGNQFEEMYEDRYAMEVSDHCVVVLSCDIDRNVVELFDPAADKIKLAVSVGHFMDAWNDSGRFMVEVFRE